MPNSTATLTIFCFLCCFFLFTNSVQSQSNQRNAQQKTSKKLDYPIYKGCGKHEGNTKQLKACMARKVRDHVIKKINHDVFTVLKTRTQFNVSIGVDEEGVIVFFESSPYIPQFEEEFIRIIESLPKIEPGKVNNQPVRVKIGLPITIQPAPPKKKKYGE